MTPLDFDPDDTGTPAPERLAVTLEQAARMWGLTRSGAHYRLRRGWGRRLGGRPVRWVVSNERAQTREGVSHG